MEKKEFIKFLNELVEDSRKEIITTQDREFRNYLDGKITAYECVSRWLEDVYCQ